ncbi:antitoxin Xre-like helix-turn-helix domain-containing protein [Mucilaginibacter sp.]
MSYKMKDEVKNEFKEPMVAYITRSQGMPLYNLFGGAAAFSSDFDMVKLARQGFPKKALLALAKKISLSIQELANILHISERTLQRYEDDAIIKTEYAEKAVELARLYTRGEEVFGSLDKFKLWVKAPSLVFNGEAPVSFLDTSAGFDMVFNELGRIEHGIFA